MAFSEANFNKMEVLHVNVSFLNFESLEFDYRKGVLIVKGESGVGKTTLLKLIANLTFGSGHISLDHQTPASLGVTTWRSSLIYVPQRPPIQEGTPREFFKMVSQFKIHRHKTLEDPLQIALA